MKKTKLFIGSIILASLLYFSCKGNNSNTTTGKDTADSNTATTTSSSSGDASFSCKIDGKDFSGKGNNDYSNVALKSSPGILNFTLVSMNPDQQGLPQQLTFFVSDKGTTTIHEDNNGSYSLDYRSGDKDKNFICKQMTVAITSSNASGVKGTFSGVLTDPNTNKDISCTDGIFNIPWSPSSKK